MVDAGVPASTAKKLAHAFWSWDHTPASVQNEALLEFARGVDVGEIRIKFSVRPGHAVRMMLWLWQDNILAMDPEKRAELLTTPAVRGALPREGWDGRSAPRPKQYDS